MLAVLKAEAQCLISVRVLLQQAKAQGIGQLGKAVRVRVVSQVSEFDFQRQCVTANLTVVIGHRLVSLARQELNRLNHHRWYALFEQLSRRGGRVLEDVMQQRRGDGARIGSIDIAGHPTDVLNVRPSRFIYLSSMGIGSKSTRQLNNIEIHNVNFR